MGLLIGRVEVPAAGHCGEAEEVRVHRKVADVMGWRAMMLVKIFVDRLEIQ